MRPPTYLVTCKGLYCCPAFTFCSLETRELLPLPIMAQVVVLSSLWRYFHKIVIAGILLCLLLWILIYYSSNSISKSSSSLSKTEFVHVHDFLENKDSDVKPKSEIATTLPLINESFISESEKFWEISQDQGEDDIFVLIPLTNARVNRNLQTKFEVCVSSMSHLSSAVIHLYVIGDQDSRNIARSFVATISKQNVKLTLLDIDVLAKQMDKLIRVMQQHFTYNADSYYSQTLFFLSTFMHVLTPRSLHRLIMLDADLQFRADVKHLNELFRQFAPGNVIGIAYEMQPVYRHVLAKYRQAHPETPAGAPKPSGNPGFNSGVLLLNLDEMRLSQQYNSLLSADVVQKLAEKYAFKGHLADQDFYTLISLEHMELFYVLPCTWNRQLCQWWRDKGYEDVFDHYFSCEGDVNIYHGNCNTPFPSP
ncbi:xyloside xylosyltransferase 1-like [Pomacea canaliculata]|nr:xyloside xylosyltransferase 1-like [Pomacea canaliculata]